MSAHRCTARTEGFCEWCDRIAERAAEIRDERDDFDDRALWNFTPEYGDMLTKGGW